MAEQQVQLTDLNAVQLQEVKKQLDQELDHLTTSYSQLKQAQTKFKSCIANVDELSPTSKGKEVLIPLTSSLYVPGKLTDVENVVIDVGTGYYIKKTKAEATTHYTSKSEFVQTNLDTLQQSIETKQNNVQSVQQVLAMKMQQAQGAAASEQKA
ncbi:prefoldin alpha subunit [Cryptococcus deuterogattii R265]|uniref:Prefoldin alpha subunit n=1 Tax=Cryptococcus deuterogattii (strain R265) TaxID=294750 RepID=A0A095D800_CRYD2|nr:prefoldin alpha subunit [Cryptococcus deuterogattii R265]KIR30018.1 prefoldin, alpha subunit [Cryptococcus deuterogattii LA55]KIR75195.1 prefoldin, alpha subunit [Cryptococcus deuterogattii CA1014]KIR92864.1 prefoldin, alpha subunit [Cryptococcus deuterogattii CBS 10090]